MKLRALTLLVIWTSLILLAGSLKAQTFSSTDTPSPFASPTTSTINVPVGGSILDVNVQLSITTDFEDTAITLQSPQGTIVPLVTDSFADDGTFTFLFDDAGAPYINQPGPGAGLFPVDGTYAPQFGELLSSFNGEDPSGNWILTSTIAFGGLQINNWDLILVLGAAVVPTAGFTATPVEQPVLVTNMAPINSMWASAIPFGGAHSALVGNALRYGPNVNDRLPRAWAGPQGEPFGGPDGLQGQGFLDDLFNSNDSSSLLRYLAFVQDENMSYKVALGLADGEERTVEVNMVDTLSVQSGTLLNGQSLGGGLPYAMMGVPLMPMAGGVATVQIVEAVPSGKAVIDDGGKAVVEATPWNRWEIFASGDFSFYDQDQLSDLTQGFDTDTYAGSIGIEYRLKRWLNVGMAWSYLESDTNVSGNLGDIDLEGNVISGYATAFWRQYWADLLYSYSSFDSDLRRNTGLGSKARGATDSQGHNIRLNFGRNFNVGRNIVTGPIAGLGYTNGDIDPYSETGGGLAAVDYAGTGFESMISRVGWQATHFRPTGWGRLVSQVHLAWEHEYMPENGTVGASLQTSPFTLVTGGSSSSVGGFSAEGDGAHPGTDWLSAGVGLRFELNNGVSVKTDYQGAFFRNNASQHYASAKLSYEWGAFQPYDGQKEAVKELKKEVKSLREELNALRKEEGLPPLASSKAAPAARKSKGKQNSKGLLGWRKKNRDAATEAVTEESVPIVEKEVAKKPLVATPVLLGRGAE